MSCPHSGEKRRGPPTCRAASALFPLWGPSAARQILWTPTGKKRRGCPQAAHRETRLYKKEDCENFHFFGFLQVNVRLKAIWPMSSDKVLNDAGSFSGDREKLQITERSKLLEHKIRKHVKMIE